jgi:hypothetical protein
MAFLSRDQIWVRNCALGFRQWRENPSGLLIMTHTIENADISSVTRYQAQEHVRAMAFHVTMWPAALQTLDSGSSGEEASGINAIVKVSTRMHPDLAGVTDSLVIMQYLHFLMFFIGMHII